jgi:hypothetical protein
VHEYIVSRICTEAKILEDQYPTFFMSPRKSFNIPKTATNLDDFEKNVHRTMFVFYNRGKFPTVKEIRFFLREKILYQGSVSSTLRVLKCLGFKYNKSMFD